MFLGSLFVAVIFLSSYGAFNNNTATTSSTTSIANVKTYFVSGSSNAIVVNYSNVATLLVNKSVNASSSNQILATLNTLESNGSINSYIEINNSFQIFLSTINAYSLEQLFYTKLGSNKTTAVNASSIVSLPKTITMYLNKQSVPMHLTQTNYSMNIFPLRQVGNTIKVSLNAIVTANGTVYQNQITIKQQ